MTFPSLKTLSLSVAIPLFFGAVGGTATKLRVTELKIASGTTLTVIDAQGNAGPIFTDGGTTVDLTGDGGTLTGFADLPIADGGTGQGTATAAFDALDPLTTQGDVLYHNGTNTVRLGPGTSGHFLKTNGAGANPAWASSGNSSLTTKEATSSTTNTTTTPAIAGGLQWTGLAASTTHYFECDLVTESAAGTTGVQVGIDISGTATAISYSCQVLLGGSADAVTGAVTTEGTAGCPFTGSVGANVLFRTQMEGRFTTEASVSTVDIIFASEVGSSEVRIRPTSRCSLVAGS